MSNVLADNEVALLHEIAENGVDYMTGEKFEQLEWICHCFDPKLFDRTYWQVRMFLYEKKWFRISNDELQLFALELLRLLRLKGIHA